MTERKNYVLLFSKVPEPGLVKTRLSVLKDGMYAPEDTSYLYHCMLFDVVEIISAALADLSAESEHAVEQARQCAKGNAEGSANGDANPSANGDAGSSISNVTAETDPLVDTYHLVISTAPASNAPVMEKLFADAGEWPWPITFIADEGANFDEHYNHAFQQCWDAGADCILSMGADMPALTKRDIKFGFQQLHRLSERKGGGVVLAPDQEMGVSVVGWTRNTDFDHTGVYYCQNGLTVLPAYIQKAKEQGLPVLWLPPIPDVDTMADLFHNATLVSALSYCAEHDDVVAPHRTAAALEYLGLDEIRVAPNDLRDPREHIDQA